MTIIESEEAVNKKLLNLNKSTISHYFNNHIEILIITFLMRYG